MAKKRTLVYLEIALVSSMSLVLSYVPINLFNAGIDISLSFIPVSVLAIRRGVLPAMLAGLLCGIMAILTGKAYFLTVFQVIIEYPLAFSCAGFVGVFRKKIINKEKYSILWIFLTVSIGAFARWFWHFLAGVIFWGSYAPEQINPIVYSLLLNGASFIFNALLLSTVLIVLSFKIDIWSVNN